MSPGTCHCRASQPYTKVSCSRRQWGAVVEDVAPSLPVGAANPEWGGHRHWGGSGRAGKKALVVVNVKDVRHCFINVQTLPNKEAQVSPEPPVRAGGSRQGWGGGVCMWGGLWGGVVGWCLCSKR